MRSLPLLVCGALLLGALGVQEASAQRYRSSTSQVVIIDGQRYYTPSNSVYYNSNRVPDSRGYVSSSGARRSYRGSYGRDGSALQRPRATSSVVINEGGRVTTVTEYSHGSPYVRPQTSYPTYPTYPSYRSNYYVGGRTYGISPSYGSSYSPYRVRYGSRPVYPYYRYGCR